MRTQRILWLPLRVALWALLPWGCSGIFAPADPTMPCDPDPRFTCVYIEAGHGGDSSQGGAGAGVGGSAGQSHGGSGQAGKGGATGGKGGASGKGGQGGAQAGSAGAEPDASWFKVADVLGVPLEELKEPEKHRLFSWGPCEWTDHPDCEQLVLGTLAPMHKFGGLIVQVHDDGSQVRVAVVVSRTEVAAITDEEGYIVRAFRQPDPTPQISPAVHFSAFLVHQNHFALPVFDKISPTPTGILGIIDQPELTLFKPEWPKPELGAGAQGFALNSKRWAMWIAQAAMVSMDAFNGKSIGVFSDTDKQKGLLSIDGLTATDNHFLSTEWWLSDGGTKSRPRIVISDGVQPAQPLLSPLPDGDDGNPMFASTHVGWFRGYGYQDMNLYEKVELWASPISSDGGGLQPAKVMDLPAVNVSYDPYQLAGGWGRIMFPEGTQNEPAMRIVDLTQKHEPVAPPLTKDLPLRLASGITRTHAWFGLGKTPPTVVVRWKLPPGGSFQP